jgi:Iap family predicted aminopeptidase
MWKFLLTGFLLVGRVHGETVHFKILNEGVLEQRLGLAHRDVAERYVRLKALFEQTGCGQLREQRVRRSKQPNIICSSSGQGQARIVVGAHYDSAGGDGTIDNWTGAILLPSLAQFVREKNRRHAFEFVAFAAEEKGLLGSRAYLKSLTPEERKQIAAVITLDSLGLSATKFWPNSSTKELISMAALLAYSMKLEFSGVNVDAVGTTDSATFHKEGIPVLSLHSVTQETWKVINSRRDVRASLSWKDYYDTHRFVSALLMYLDQKLP